MTIYSTFLSALLESIILVEKRYGGTAERYGMTSDALPSCGRQVPYCYGKLRAQRKVRDSDWEFEPFIPGTRALERPVSRLKRHGQGFGVGP